jgi:hypothetical protein
MTSSVSANGREPLCGGPFSQVARDRRCQSYVFYRRAVNAFSQCVFRLTDAVLVITSDPTAHPALHSRPPGCLPATSYLDAPQPYTPT